MRRGPVPFWCGAFPFPLLFLPGFGPAFVHLPLLHKLGAVWFYDQNLYCHYFTPQILKHTLPLRVPDDAVGQILLRLNPVME